MTISRRLALATGAVVAAALTVTGCGSHEQATPAATPTGHARQATAAAGTSAVTAVRLAAATVHRVNSAHVTGTFHVTATANGTPTTVDTTYAGDMQWGSDPRMRATFSGMKLGGIDVGATEMIMTPRSVWMSMPILTQQTGKKWLEFTPADESKVAGFDTGQLFAQQSQMDPAQYVDLLTASGNLDRAGAATVDGIPTTRYTGDVDPAKALAAVGRTMTSAQKALIKQMGITSEHVDLWLDSQHHIVREDVSTKSTVMSLDVSMHLSHYGVAVSAAAPPASQTLDFSSLMQSAGGLNG